MAPMSLKIVSDEGAVTRTVKFESNTKVKDACAVIKEKITGADDGKEYALFVTSADDDRSGVWLEPHRSLEYYMLRDGDSLLYLSKLRNLRIRMLDGSLKTLQVDETKNVGELMITVCSKIGITNHDEYGLCHEEEHDNEEPKEKESKPATGTLTLKRKAQQRERDTKMELLSKKLKTDDNVEWLDQHRTLREQGVDPTVTVLLKRRLFFSDRKVDSRDPVQLNLLYVQTRDAILNGRHSVTESQGPNMTSLFGTRYDIKLIKLVKNHPILYDYKHNNYKDYNKREIVWQKISDSMRRPAKDCKRRWGYIRDTYRTILRRTLKGEKATLYKYHNELTFMTCHYKELEGIQNIAADYDNPEDDSHDSAGAEQEAEPARGEDTVETDESDKAAQDVTVIRTPKRRSVQIRRRVSYQGNDPIATVSSPEMPTPSASLDPSDKVDAFLLSIGTSLKTFTPYHLNLAKSKIFSIVQDHELQMINSEDNNS